jgi:hypothetical protein
LRRQGEVDLHTYRHGRLFVLPNREHPPHVIAVNLRSHLFAPFTPKSGEGFSKIGITSRVTTKRMFEYRNHSCLCVVVVSHERYCVEWQQDAFPVQTITPVQRLAQ